MPANLRFVPTLTALLAAFSFGACTAPEPAASDAAPIRAAASTPIDPPADHEARASADPSKAVEARLRALFPEIQGEITRESIARALSAERERAAVNAAAPSRAPQDRRERASAAVERGDYEDARATLGELIVEQDLARASELIAHGDARAALAILDQAVEIAPHNTAARCMRGDAAVRVGGEDGELALVEAALADYLAAAHEDDGVIGWIGASRAASSLGRVDEALEYAQSGVRSQKANPRQVAGVPPERTLAEACFQAYVAAHRADGGGALAPGGGSAQGRQSFDACKSALEALIALAPSDAWAWQHLSALYESEGLASEAQSIALRGLNEAPADEELHQRLARIATSTGGRASLLAVYADFKAHHPSVALAEWYPAVAHFDAAVEALSARAIDAGAGVPKANAKDAGLDAARGSFQDAEKGFARCRTLDPKYADACRSYEISCRDGEGWCAYHAGDLDLAQKAFLSMEDLRPGGLTSEIEHKLASGVAGLHWVGGAYAARAQSENSLASLENLERAGKVYDFLHEYQPDDANWANDSGFFNRDTAVALERKARGLADQGQVDEANRLLDRARELMDKSYRAYVDAARLAPDDVRIQNDTGLILTYYLQRDVDRASAYLKRAAELGEQQVPELERESKRDDLTPEQRDERKKKLEYVESALGDAYQNLGVLALTLDGDPKSARAWFAKSLATGEDAREEISRRGGYLEQCDDALAGRSNPLVTDKTRWGVPRASKSDNKTK
jgi:tetratricopeptide (TPR) repeat protein